MIWMVDDTLKFRKEDFVSFKMTPEVVVDFVEGKN
jgi:hypothetical protein